MFASYKERKRIVVEELKKELSESYEKRTGKKPTYFFELKRRYISFKLATDNSLYFQLLLRFKLIYLTCIIHEH